VKYRKLNCHSDIELHNRLIYLVKSSNTEFCQLTNPSAEPSHLPELSWLVLTTSYFRDVIYIPSCHLNPAVVLKATQSVPDRLYCLQVLNCSRWKGENSDACCNCDIGKLEVPCKVVTGFIGAVVVSSFSLHSKKNSNILLRSDRTNSLKYTHTISRTLHTCHISQC